MKKRILGLFFLLTFSPLMYGQMLPSLTSLAGISGLNVYDSARNFGTKIGLTRVGDQWYYTARFQPEYTIGKKLAIGFDIPISISTDGSGFRKEEYQNGTGAMRLVRYIRYGVRKRDKVYFRYGDISGASLGAGGLVNNYTNSISFERRKVGFMYDILIFKTIGIEGLYSDLNPVSFNLFAVRPYVRPLGKTEIPILNSLEVGVTFAADRDKTKQTNISNADAFKKSFVDNGFSGVGFDATARLVDNEKIKLNAYIQYNILNNINTTSFDRLVNASTDSLRNAGKLSGSALEDGYQSGSGFSAGVSVNFKVNPETLVLDAKLEYLNYTDHYTPQFFDAGYELNKDAKLRSLLFAKGIPWGIYGSVAATVKQQFQVAGGLLLPNEVTEATPAILQLSVISKNLMEGKLNVMGSYIRSGLTDLADAIQLDERSLANARVVYQLNSFLTVGADAMWTFAKTEDGSFKATQFITPYFGLNFPLGKSKN